MELNLHKHHRTRVRARFLKDGIDSMTDHEILELLLFYARPRIDTNALAHRLIDRFGSLGGVFEAYPEELEGFFGLGKSSAVLIKLVYEIYAKERFVQKKAVSFRDYDKTGRFLASVFKTDKTERVVVVMLDGKDKLINMCTISEGGHTTANVDMRKLAQVVVMKNAAKVIIAHNHTNGSLKPSQDDRFFTSSVQSFLDTMGVELKEHYIIADGSYVGIKQLMRDNKFIEG